jgi:16S rRNA G966 N2-methylase RsmD
MNNAVIALADVVVEDRMRKDFGSIDDLANSIKKYGLLQPIILGLSDVVNGQSCTYLLAGERRLRSMKRLGITHLEHAKHYVWRGEEGDEDKKVRFKAIELEENLKRKELTWQEQLLGKQQLLTMMQEIYGQPRSGPPSALAPDKPGFGVNKLAAMLGESVGTTSQDLQVAALLTQIPALRNAKTKSEVLSKMKIAGTVLGMQAAATQRITDRITAGLPAAAQSYWELHETSFDKNKLLDESVDLIWSDLPYGADVTAVHDKTEIYHEYDDSRASLIMMLDSIATESYRVLRNDRYAVFCFGFNYYPELVQTLKLAGFHVNPVPCIWNKGTKFGANPLVAYCIGYEPLLVAWKGSPRFIRPGQSNVFNYPPPENRIHLVQKPVVLVKQFLEDMTTEGAVVVDWCAGTGTTGVACHEMKRHAILFERDPSMAMLAKARLEELK